MPLGNDNTRQQAIAKLGIQATQVELDIKQFKQNLSSRVLTLWLTLNELKQIQKSLTTELDYRDLYLERASTHYEMALENDIGDALTQFTNTEYKLAKRELEVHNIEIKIAEIELKKYQIYAPISGAIKATSNLRNATNTHAPKVLIILE